MGLLDDAIREHLELKRRRGADPTEVEQEEQEALGPVRPVAQGSAGVAEYQEPDAPLDDEGSAAEIDPEAEFEDEDADWVEEEEFEEPEGPHADYGEPPAEEPLETADRHGVVPPPEPSPTDEPSPPPPGPPPGPLTADPGMETAEYDVEAEHAAEKAGGETEGEGDDMLEETPEFLQDAPDHDRLWFEQRPPKDFDFDG